MMPWPQLCVEKLIMANPVLWTAQELIAATGGTLHGEVRHSIHGVSIDSRAVADGDVFVAIKGEKQDGHDYVVEALKNGAAVAVVSRVTDEMRSAGAILQVADDPLRGLESMGRAARAWSSAQIVAITGSVGKTSTKEMLRVALAASGDTHASAASFNNHWGVPLTLARLSRQAAFGIFEVGMNHSGEIEPLVKMVRPHVAIVTTIAASHLGHFNSLDEIADAKAEIFTGVVSGGSAVINQDSPYFEKLAAAAKHSGIKNIVGFGRHESAAVRLERVALHPNCCCITADILGEKVTYKLGVPGEHMAINSLAVLATAKIVGADLARAALALADAAPAKGRGVQERFQINDGEFLLIDESYNANPASITAALALLGNAKVGTNGRRIAVLGDMLELGQFGPSLHAEISQSMAAHKVDILYASGPLMAHLWDVTPANKRGAYAKSSVELTDILLSELRSGDSVMIKGSLGSRMGVIVDAIRARFAATKKES
jgi:UDP-N-acetylmuramoyl-tripeptide--D-alanyl-D-alanine ligase